MQCEGSGHFVLELHWVTRLLSSFPPPSCCISPIGWHHAYREPVSGHTFPHINCVPKCLWHSSWTSWPFEMGSIGCPKMSVWNYHTTAYLRRALISFILWQKPEHTWHDHVADDLNPKFHNCENLIGGATQKFPKYLCLILTTHWNFYLPPSPFK